MLSKINIIRSQDFGEAWIKALYFVLEHGVDIVFGDVKEPKHALDSCQLIELSGNAIEQIKAGEVHPDFYFNDNLLHEYCDKFTRRHLKEYNGMSVKERAVYIYFDRLANYPIDGGDVLSSSIDQIEVVRDGLREQIESGIDSNRTQAITWIPRVDARSNEPPCWQRLWVRYVGNGLVDVHLDWRSRDLFKAWPANMVAIVDMLYREVMIPNNCDITRILDFSDSLHIYETDMDDVLKVGISPMVLNH